MTLTKIDKPNVNDQIAGLNAFFSSLTLDPAVELVYLFGSRATQTAGPLSDYDIGVYFSAAPDFNVKYHLEHQTGKILNTRKVDIVVLNRAPIELKYAVIATGTVIFEDFQSRAG